MAADDFYFSVFVSRRENRVSHVSQDIVLAFSGGLDTSFLRAVADRTASYPRQPTMFADTEVSSGRALPSEARARTPRRPRVAVDAGQGDPGTNSVRPPGWAGRVLSRANIRCWRNIGPLSDRQE
jgi:hypothetical protein